MNNVKRALVELKEEGLDLRVVPASNAKKTKPSAPLVLPSRVHARRARPELAALGWEKRAIRLAGRN
jgi:hypothetical protein